MNKGFTGLFPGTLKIVPAPSGLAILILTVANKATKGLPGIREILATPDIAVSTEVEANQTDEPIEGSTKAVNDHTVPYEPLDGHSRLLRTMILAVHRLPPRLFCSRRNRRIPVPKLIALTLRISVVRSQAVKTSNAVRTSTFSVPQPNLEGASPVHETSILIDKVLVVLPVRLRRNLLLECLAVLLESLSIALDLPRRVSER